MRSGRNPFCICPACAPEPDVQLTAIGSVYAIVDARSAPVPNLKLGVWRDPLAAHKALVALYPDLVKRRSSACIVKRRALIAGDRVFLFDSVTVKLNT
jgi:hypothetical protein